MDKRILFELVIDDNDRIEDGFRLVFLRELFEFVGSNNDRVRKSMRISLIQLQEA